MQYVTKNKWLMALLLLLLVANIITIAAFWLQRPPQAPVMKERPDAYLTRELALDANQQQAYAQLVKEHQQHVAELRKQVKSAKDDFFKLLQQPVVQDSEKTNAAKNISTYTEQLDLVTFDHFKKLRAICNPEQQKKFDNVIAEAMRMIASSGPEQNRQRPPGAPEGPPERRQGPPPGEGPPPPPPGQ
ncbi:MAG: periplasmic heavy metal sensor [Chitinophagaceae bacterium]